MDPVCSPLLLTLVLSSVPVLPSPASIQQQGSQDVRRLTRGKPIERELAGDQTHSYSVALRSGQYLHLVVDQRGIDVVVTLFGPDGKKLTEVDSPNGTQGPEPVFFVAEFSGTHRLEVHSLERTAAPGRYEAKIDELRVATGQDRSRVAAQEALAQAELLRGAGTAASLRGAIGKFEEALSALRAAGDRQGEAETLHKIGFLYGVLGENQRALEYYQQALPLLRAVGNRDGEPLLLSNIGRVYGDLGENQRALDYFAQALPLFRAAGDRRGEGVALTRIGIVYSRLGEKQKALEYYGQALLLRRALGDRGGEATTLNNIGLVYNDLGENQKALEYYAQALPLSRALGDRGGEATTLSNIGAVYQVLAENQKALDYFAQALPLFRAAGDRRSEAYTLSNIGVVYSVLGEKQKALEYYGQALPLRRALGDRGGEAVTLTNIGLVYSDLGENQKALDYYAQALPLYHAVGNRRGEAATLSNIGMVYSQLGEKQKALDRFAQALPLRRALGDRQGEATTLNNIGTVYRDLGENQKALDYYAQALPIIRAVGDRRGEARTLTNIGLVYKDLGENQKAVEYYAQALPLNRAFGDRPGEAVTLRNLAGIEDARGNLEAALTNIESALSLIDSLRTRVWSQQLRASYFATVQKYHEFYIAVLMRLHKQNAAAGYDRRALQASERARARSLLETLAEANADIRQGVDSTLLERERRLQRQLNVKAEQQFTLLRGTHTAEQASRLAKELDSLTTELQQAEAAIRTTSPRYAALTQPRPLTAKEIQDVLDPGTLLLEYSLGDSSSYLWAVTPTSLTSYQLPKRSEIEAAARSFYELLNTPAQVYARDGQKEMRETASRLSRMLLGPVAAQLGQKRLVVVADGVLQYLPFAALPDPTTLKGPSTRLQPLIVRHEIVSLPSVSVLATLRSEQVARGAAPRTVAVIADPVFYSDDERVKRRTQQESSRQPAVAADSSILALQVTRSAEESGARRDGGRLARLPGSRKEAQGILALVHADRARAALDFEASRAFATSGELKQYRYVHFATHGLLNSLHPELSAMVLSLVDEDGNPTDGFLRAHEVYNLSLLADVVVLSGCQTGLGKEVRGEGLIGLTRGFMYAGAPRVVVSLWRVDDDATAELMVSFYRAMLQDGKRPAEALRAAQIEMWKQDRWRAPHHWAAFVLQGEWK